jgi:hypothetical protein
MVHVGYVTCGGADMFPSLPGWPYAGPKRDKAEARRTRQKQGRSKRSKQARGASKGSRSKRSKQEEQARGASKQEEQARRRRQIQQEECKTDPATQTYLDMKQV